MWMKWRKTVTLAFLILIGGNVFGQQRSPIDLILVLDTSSGMSRYYSQVNHYLTGSFLQDNLRLGDTFHLIAFSNEPRVEITRRVEGRGDLETIIGRMLLMYPLEPQADIPAALSFLKTYTENLNPSRPRKIIILSLGEGTAVTAESFPRLLEESRRQLGGDLEHINPAGLPLPSARPAVPEPPRPAVPAVTPAPVPRPEVPAATPAPIPRPEVPPTPVPQTGAPAIPIPEQPPVPRVEPLPPVPRPDPSPPRPAVPAVTPAPIPRPEVPPTPVPQAGAPSISIPEQPPAPRVESRPPAPELLPPVPIPEPEALVPPPVPGPEPLPIPELEAPPVSEPLSGIEPLEPSEESATVPAPVSPVSPQNTPRRTERPVREGSGRVVIFILLGLLGLVLLGLAAFFLIRRLHESPNRAVARAAGGRDSRRSRTTGSRGKEPQKNPQIRTQSPPRNISGAAEPPVPRAAEPYRPPRRESPYTDTYKPAKRLEYGSPFMLKLFVADQNTLIGKRNTHRVKPGFTYTVGGGKSDFLIFLVPFPPRLGELKYESSGCTFYPRKAAYFPDIGNNPVHDCIGKTIRVISDRGYEIFMRLEQHEDPLLELNRLMLSINVPNPTGMQPPG